MDRGKIDSLTGLRFFAALWVLLMHFKEFRFGHVWVYPIGDSLARQGFLGVDLFFVLSGFILSYVYEGTFKGGVSKANYAGFMRFRFARLYPVHFVTFAFMLAMAAAQFVFLGQLPLHPERYSWATVLTTLTLTHSWVDFIFTPNMPAWSISAEFFAYLFFPFLMLFVRRGVYAAAGIAILGVYALGLDYGPISEFLVRVAGGFLLGMATFQYRDALPARGPLGAMFFLAALALCQWAPLPVTAVLFALGIAALTHSSDWLGKALALRPIVYLGEISYALYMVHWPVRVVLRTVIEKAHLADHLPAPAIVTLYVATSLVGAAFLYHAVEKPGRTFLRTKRAVSPAVNPAPA